MDVSPYYALIVAGNIFGFVALMHLLRLIYQSQVTIAGKIIPMWVSRLGFLLPLALSIWMFMASSQAIAMPQGGNMGFILESSAFSDSAFIPAKFTCDGENISPPLNWKGEPQDTKSFVLIVDDPDATAGTWDHWILFNIPASAHELSENISTLPKGAEYGKNSWDKTSYGGPCPPQGVHRYLFNLYALDTTLPLSYAANKSQIEAAMKGHILGTTTLTGKYQKK